MAELLDARQLPCPQPILQAKKIIKSLHAGDVLIVYCKDAITIVDFKGFCSVANHEVLEVIQYDDYYEIRILI